MHKNTNALLRSYSHCLKSKNIGKKSDDLVDDGMRFKIDARSVLDGEGMRFKKDPILDEEGIEFNKSFTHFTNQYFM